MSVTCLLIGTTIILSLPDGIVLLPPGENVSIGPYDGFGAYHSQIVFNWTTIQTSAGLAEIRQAIASCQLPERAHG